MYQEENLNGQFIQIRTKKKIFSHSPQVVSGRDLRYLLQGLLLPAQYNGADWDFVCIWQFSLGAIFY